MDWTCQEESHDDIWKQRWLDCLMKRTRVDRAGHAVRTMDQKLSRSNVPAGTMLHSPGGNLEPPAYSQDWVQFASHNGTFQHRKPPSQMCHSMDYTRDLPATCYGLVKELSVVDTKDLMAGVGREINW